MRVVDKKRLLVKDQLKKECLECKGEGCGSCVKKGQMVDKMADANIPVTYWFLKMKDFSGPENVKKSTTDYILTIKDNYLTGKGLCFTGTYGVGKTTAACAVLKNALINEFTAYYTTLTDLIHYMMDYETRNEFTNLVTRVDFLCVDEVDSRHFSTSDEAQKTFGSNFERVIRYRTQNRLPTIIASNNASLDEVFTGQHRRVVDSLTSVATLVVPSMGKDIRKTK